MSFVLIAAPLTGVVALLFALYKASYINKVSPGNDRMQEIARYIQEGSMAFLSRQYKSLAVFIEIGRASCRERV